MPNHCFNTLLISGANDDLEKFLADCKFGDVDFSFEGILPCPSRLKESVAGSDQMGYEIKYTNKWQVLATYPWLAEHIEGPITRESVMAAFAKLRPKEMELADFYKENLDLYGCLSWYDWCINHWGTKWDAYDVQPIFTGDGEVEITFKTAWGPPTGWLSVAAEKYPGLSFRNCWQEEGGHKGVELAGVDAHD